ncbi:glycosyltransferase family 4 protein [Thiobacillus thioparus]|uniref:glycosyltransferase family 4 protein n=1 Tax=Thiobacillus thioparus TaxID=931 RepID=UPI0003A8C8D9|nr:glycosyltransferase family 4 protein [Thiobacillus thioparus]
MKILLSAFGCVPNSGSEGGVGWRWAIELCRAHEVVMVTDVTRRGAIEDELEQNPQPNLRVVYFRPWWLCSIPLNSTTAQLLYSAWQFALLPFARNLHRSQHFDLAMHLTYGVFRHPSFLGYLGIPFIFGPLGGGEDAPLKLKRSILGREKLKEYLRTLINKVVLLDPFLWVAYAKATLILVKTEDTRQALPWPFRKRAIVYAEIGIDPIRGIIPTVRQGDEPLRVLFVGRLLGWKGAHLAIRAVAEALSRGVAIDFTLVGRGPYEDELKRVAKVVGILDRIHWVSYIPQKELFPLYRQMHCFLFPSLHDSSGNVVLEAQANGLPVICLDIGGPVTLVSDETAIIVPTQGLDEVELVNLLADALGQMAANEGRRNLMCQRALASVDETMTWEGRVKGVFQLLENKGVTSGTI